MLPSVMVRLNGLTLLGKQRSATLFALIHVALSAIVSFPAFCGLTVRPANSLCLPRQFPSGFTRTTEGRPDKQTGGQPDTHTLRCTMYTVLRRFEELFVEISILRRSLAPCERISRLYAFVLYAYLGTTANIGGFTSKIEGNCETIQIRTPARLNVHSTVSSNLRGHCAGASACVLEAGLLLRSLRPPVTSLWLR